MRDETYLIQKSDYIRHINDKTKLYVMLRRLGIEVAKLAGIPNEVIRYACLKECASILQVDEQIIQNEIKKVVLQRKDEYLEKRKKEQEEAAKVNALPSAPEPTIILMTNPAPIWRRTAAGGSKKHCRCSALNW